MSYHIQKIKQSLLAIGLFLSYGLPFFAFAQPPENFQELIKKFTDLINPLLFLLSSIAVLVFIWGIIKYIASAGDENKKTSGRNTMFYGIIGIFVLFTFWGIVGIIERSIFG